MQTQTVEAIAYRLWMQRNCPFGDEQRDFYRAKMIQEQRAHYLAYQAEYALADAVKIIERAAKCATGDVVVAAVQDGSTEAMEAAYERVFLASPFNGAVPTPALTAGREREFVQICHSHCAEAKIRCSQASMSPTEFPYRDASLAVFSGGDGSQGLSEQLASVVRLLTYLADYNQVRGLAWNAQIHARLSVADSVALAIGNLRYARRGNLIVATTLAQRLTRPEVHLLRAHGMRIGSSKVQTSNRVIAQLLSSSLQQSHSSTLLSSERILAAP